MADAELGREAAAEAFTRALEAWSRVGPMSSPEGWTYRVGVNVVRRRLAGPGHLGDDGWGAVVAYSPPVALTNAP